MEQKKNLTVKFRADDPPRIANRSDALELLDALIEADEVDGELVALEALRDAIEQGVA